MKAIANWTGSLVLGLSLAALAATPLSARELKFGVGVSPGHANHTGYEAFAKSLKEKTGGELDVKIYSQAFLTLSQMLAGVRDGVVDGGYVLAPIFPADFPDTQLPINLAMLGANGFAMAGAMTEYIFSCPECLAERLKNNNVYLGSVAAGPYWILSTKKITTLDELKGKKLRSGAAPWSRWAQAQGAVAMSISPNEVFETMSQGTVDGAMVPASELTNLRLIDVVKHITTGVPHGTYHGMDVHNMNRTVWRSLTESQRRAVLDSAATSSAVITLRYLGDVTRNMKDAQQKGIQIHQASPELVTRSKAFVEADLATVAQAAEKDYGTKNAAQKVARFRQLVEKWEKLTPPEVGTWEPAALAALYQREIFSKIDAKTYGM